MKKFLKDVFNENVVAGGLSVGAMTMVITLCTLGPAAPLLPLMLGFAGGYVAGSVTGFALEKQKQNPKNNRN